MIKEALILKFMRESRNLSMRRAGNLFGVSDSAVSHLENRRANLHPEIVMKLLHFYCYSYEQFIYMSSGKTEVPQSLRLECVEIIKRLDADKLKTVRTSL